jgi:acetyl-CoA carboxylase biotin carboxyl carrier protein
MTDLPGSFEASEPFDESGSPGPGSDDLEVVHAREDPVGDVDMGATLEALGSGDASLLALIDRLASLLERSDLTELEVEAGDTTLLLRTPAALASVATVVGAPSAAPVVPAVPTGGASPAPERPAVRAPLTGIFYGSPAPGSAPFVVAGSEIAIGTVIGLIEAMKLFNEIKSDLAGRVVRVVAESGALVKAKQPLIEVEPL